MGGHIQICLDLTSCCYNTEKFHEKNYLTICKITKYLFATWANALIVTCLKTQSFGHQIIIKEYQDYIYFLNFSK